MHKSSGDHERGFRRTGIQIGWSRKAPNQMTRSWKASRGREFEFDRFRHDDGGLRPVLRMERRIEEMHWG